MPDELQDNQIVNPKRKHKHGSRITTRHRQLLDEIVENRRSVAKSMLKVGYSPATATHPSQVIESDGFQALLEESLPEEMLVKVHKEGLKAFHVDRFTGKQPDFAVRHSYLTTAYKLRGRLQEVSATGIVVIPVLVKGKDDEKRISTIPSDNS